ncbi:MAG TPA: glycosyltransferase family 2 protein [Bacteroidota bacterium]|jgi:dolichol-phosphate mannosyltransferase|nr:glycosyltransferase family 2 protein [Bacteroidota bacterium]
MNAAKSRISVVIPIYNEADLLVELHHRVTATLSIIPFDYEIIYVDDGSTDNSFPLLASLSKEDSHLRIISFSRNFGHQTAISAGIQYSTGDGVILMDGDLQDPPELLPRFIEEWKRGHEVVYGIRTHRKENIFKRAAYSVFYRVLHRVSYLDIPIDSGDFCIMDRSVVDILNRMPERNRFIRGLRTWTGYRQTGIAYERERRFAGSTKYTFARLLKLAYDGLITFSFFPLQLSTKLGFLFSFLAILSALLIVFLKTTRGFVPQGWASTIVVILFISGLQFFILGIFGEYIGRIFEEVKARPQFVIRTMLGFDEQEKSS